MATLPKPAEPMTEQEQKTVLMPNQEWSDSYALKVAKRDFEYAESYRQRSHDWRYRNADEIYLAWVQQKYWEGTKQPRSSLGIYVALEQIESLLPKVLGSIFSDPDIFEVDPRPGTKPEEARATRDLMVWQLEEAAIREVLRTVLKDAFIYGNGIVELGWLYQEMEKFRYVVNWEPVFRKIQSILGPQREVIGMKRNVKKELFKDVVNMPTVKRVSPKDFYIDPHTPSPVIQGGNGKRGARYVAERAWYTIDEVLALKGPGFKIPEHAMLILMADNKSATEGDNAKRNMEAIRGGNYDPMDDSSVDPAARRVEIIKYTTATRCVWLLNRSIIIFNQPNPYGFINYFGFFYVDVPDRWHALGITDVVEGEQRLIQSITNGRVDELSLAIHASTIKRQGVRISPSQLRRRPGNVIETPDPDKDIVREQVQNVTQSAYIEVDAAERRVQKYTGITDLAVLGVPSSGGNSASRTATGVNAQSAASASRIQYLVENAEDTGFEPLLNAWHTLNQKLLNPEQVLQVLGPEGEAIQIDPLMVMNARVKFSMRASAKMQSRNSLLQTYPLVSQTFLAPQFMEALGKMHHMKVNILEMGRMLEEMTGYRRRFGELFVPMTPEEIQAMQQPEPADMLRMQMQRERISGQKEVLEDKQAGDMVLMLAEKIADAMSGEKEDDLEGKSTEDSGASEAAAD